MSPLPLLPFLLLILLLFLAPTQAHSPAPPPPPPPTPPTHILPALRKALLTNYLPHHRIHRATHPRLVLRHLLPQPGIGDRLTALLYAYVLSSLTTRILLLDWRHPLPLPPHFHSAFYYNATDAPLESARLVRNCTPSHCPVFDLRHFLISPHAPFTVVLNVSQPFHVVDIFKIARRYADRLPVAKTLLQEATLPPGPIDPARLPSDAAVFSEIFSTVLRPSHNLSALANASAPAAKRRYVAVHARLGAGVREAGPRFARHPPWKVIATCLARRACRVAKRVGVRNVAFLATDTPRFRELFRREWARACAGGRVTVGMWGTKHIGRMTSDDDGDVRLFRGALAELLVVAGAKAVVGTGSRFADVAAFWGGIEDVEVVDPGREC